MFFFLKELFKWKKEKQIKIVENKEILAKTRTKKILFIRFREEK
jgi:hypothetical protein